MKRVFRLSRLSRRSLLGTGALPARDRARQLLDDAHAQERIAHALALLGLLECARGERTQAFVEDTRSAFELGLFEQREPELVERGDARQRVRTLLGDASPCI